MFSRSYGLSREPPKLALPLYTTNMQPMLCFDFGKKFQSTLYLKKNHAFFYLEMSPVSTSKKGVTLTVL